MSIESVGPSGPNRRAGVVHARPGSHPVGHRVPGQLRGALLSRVLSAQPVLQAASNRRIIFAAPAGNLEILDRSDGSDGARESNVGEAVHQRSYHSGLGVAHLDARAAVGAELG